MVSKREQFGFFVLILLIFVFQFIDYAMTIMWNTPDVELNPAMKYVWVHYGNIGFTIAKLIPASFLFLSALAIWFQFGSRHWFSGWYAGFLLAASVGPVVFNLVMNYREIIWYFTRDVSWLM